MTIQSALAIAVNVGSSTVEAAITDGRPEIVSTLIGLTEVQRRGFVTDAWTIGLRAILNAHRNAEEARLADVGKSMLEDVDRELQGYVTRQRDVLVEILKRYFDPKDGQVAVRIEGFLKDGGELTRAMEKYGCDILVTWVAMAVRLPAECRFPPGEREAVVRRVHLAER